MLRAVGEGSFAADPLRLLRAARLAAELGLRGRPRARRRWPAPKPRAPPSPPASASSPSCGAARRPRSAARARAARRAGADRGRPARAGGAARGRAGAQPPPRRARPHAGGARAHARGRVRPGALRRRARRGAARAARRAARRRDEPRHGAALRRPPARHRQAGDPRRARGLRHLHRPRWRGGGDRRRDLRSACAPAGGSPATCRALTLHHLRLGFLVHEAPLPPRRVHEYLRATEPVAADVTLLTVADRLSARGGGPLATEEAIEAHLRLAREMLAAALDWRRDGPPEPLLRGDELAAELGIEPGPSWGSCSPSWRRRSTRAR